MFDIYIKDFNKDGQLITEETLVQTIPAEKAGDLKITNPIVKNDLGNAESFNFGIEGGTKFYDAFNQMKTFMRVVYDGDTIFYGRILTIDNGFFGTRSLRCEGPLAFLNDSSIEGVKEESRPQKTINAYFQELIDNHNSQLNDSRRSFTLGEIPGLYTSAVSEDQQVVKNADVDKKKRKYGSDSWSDTKGLIEELRSHYGGYLRVRCPGHQNGNKYVDEGHIIDWMNHYFSTGEISQTVEVGKNIIDISSSTEVDNIFTVVIPIGNTKTKTSETVDGEKKSTTPKHFYVDGREVTVPSICAKYGQALNSGYHTYDDYASALDRYGRIVKTVVFDDAENATQLLEKCQEWIKNNYQGEVTKFTVKAVDMHQIGDTKVSKIRVGDQVRLIYPVVKEDGTVEKKQLVRTCLSVSYDLYNPENNSYTFGIPANILTKSYGVLKQAGNKDSASKPKSSSSGGSSKTQDWLSQVTEWLADHKIGYKHYIEATGAGSSTVKQGDVDTRAVFPYSTTYRNLEKGPYGNRNDYFYSTEYTGGIGRFTLWQFTPVGNGKGFDQAELDKILSDIEDTLPHKTYEEIQSMNQAKAYAEQAYRNSREQTAYTGRLITLNGVLSHEDIVLCNIIGWVKQEYQIDLTNFNNIKMPTIDIKDENGITSRYEATEGGTIVTKEFFKEGFDGSNVPGYHIINKTKYDEDGKVIGVERVVSIKDADGNWKYYVEDKDGHIIPTSIRDLKWIATDSETFRGSMISEGYADENGEIQVYKFGQEIGTYYGGELITAYVQGDKVVIGNKKTTQIVNMALENISNVCGDFTYEQDPDTGDVKLIVKNGSAIYQRKDGLDMGYYHDGNLTAGVVVDKINNGDTTVNITGDHIVIGTKSGSTISNTVRLMATSELEQGLYRVVNIPGQGAVPVLEAGNRIKRTKDGVTGYYGIWDSSGQEVQGGLIVDKVNGETTSRITGDHIKIGQRTDGGISKDITLMATDSLTVGLYRVENGNAVMEAGTKIDRVVGGVKASYGLWDSSGQEVNGGLVAEKINGQTTTYLRGDRIVVGTAQTNESVMAALIGAGVIDETSMQHQALVAKDIYAHDLSVINGRFTTIETDYLQTSQLSSKLAALDVASVKCLIAIPTSSGGLGYISASEYRNNNSAYSGFTMNFGTDTNSPTHKFLGEKTSPGPGVSPPTYLNLGLQATEITSGDDAGSINIKFCSASSSSGGGQDGKGGALFNIASTKKYKSGVEASWNNAVIAAVVPTSAYDMYATYIDRFTVKIPKNYSTYHSSSGDNKYTLYEYNMSVGTFSRPGVSSIPGVILTVNGGSTKIAACDISEELADAKEEGRVIGVNSVTASSPGFVTISSRAGTSGTIYTPASVQVRSVTSTNKYSSYTSLSGRYDKYWIEGVSSQVYCFAVKNGSTIVGLYNVNGLYTTGVSDGTITGRNSVTASSPETVTITSSGGVWTPANIQVRSAADNGSKSSYKTLIFTNGVYKIPNSNNNHCVAVLDGSSTVGLYSIETVYQAGKSDTSVSDLSIWDGTGSSASQWSGSKTLASGSSVTLYPYAKKNGSWVTPGTSVTITATGGGSSVTSKSGWWTTTAAGGVTDAKSAAAYAMSVSASNITVVYANSQSSADTWAFFKVGSSPYIIGF